MDFNYSDDQLVFRDSVSKFLNGNYDFETRQAIVAADSPFDGDTWSACADLGWLYLPFSEEQGGLGGSAVDMMLLFEELGRHLVVEPFLETLVLFGGILRRVDTASAVELIEPLMTGTLHGALAHGEALAGNPLGNIRATAVRDGDNFLISGHKRVVYNAPAADWLIVSALLENGDTALFLVSRDTPGLTVQAYATVDGRSAGEVLLDNARAGARQLLAQGPAADRVLAAVLDDAALVLTAEAVGAMEVLREATVDYSRERRQFGTRISTFQVLQHMMVDMFMATELTRSLMYAAAIKLRDAAQEAPALVAAAKAKADRSGRAVAHSAIQIHGGIATTDELRVGHYLKRMTVTANLLGNTRYQVRRFAALGAPG